MCNLCDSKEFCGDCRRSEEDEEFGKEIVQLSTKDQRRNRLAGKKEKSKNMIRVQGEFLFFHEQPYHIISFKLKNANYKVYTREGVLFYIRIIIPRKGNPYCVLIKKEKFSEQNRIKELNGGEILKCLPLPAPRKLIRNLALG